MVTIHTMNKYLQFNGGVWQTTIMVQREDARLGTIATAIVKDANLERGEPYRTVKALITAMKFMGEDVTVTGDLARDFR